MPLLQTHKAAPREMDLQASLRETENAPSIEMNRRGVNPIGQQNRTQSRLSNTSAIAAVTAAISDMPSTTCSFPVSR